MSGICANCKGHLGRCTGESQLYGSHHTLCEPCWLEEDDLVEEEGTNCGDYSEVIRQRLRRYGAPNSDRW